MTRKNFTFTSESVSEGHPDKVADSISDAILDAYLQRDPRAHVAVETLCKDGLVVLAGEVAAACSISSGELEEIVRQTIRDIGYTEPDELFNADGIQVVNAIGGQSAAINHGVGKGNLQGAGDQGMMYGYACEETPELMPLPICLAHSLTSKLADARKSGKVGWLRPDAKAQVTVRYTDGLPTAVTDVVVSTQHRRTVDRDTIENWVRKALLPNALGSWNRPEIRLLVNPAGQFVLGGPEGDCGVTGRKIIVDTYGGYARHGGGAFSGKDASKVDRSAAYFARHVAREIVLRGLASHAEVQVAYAIGRAKPVSLQVDTRGTGNDDLAAQYAAQFDFRPAAIADRLGLLAPIYSSTTNYGHFGRPGLPWEK